MLEQVFLLLPIKLLKGITLTTITLTTVMYPLGDEEIQK